MFFVGFEHSRKWTCSYYFAAEPIAICNENQSASQLIDFEYFSNFHFAITRDNCGHIFRYVEAADFQNTAGARQTYSSVCQLKG